jgi:hypothetical protein
LSALRHPFELSSEQLEHRLDEMVDVCFEDLTSQFLILPKGKRFLPFREFQAAYEMLKGRTAAFSRVNEETLWAAVVEDGLTLVVLRTILGLSPPEWADLASQEGDLVVPTGAARVLDVKVRADRALFGRRSRTVTRDRALALIRAAAKLLSQGPPTSPPGTLHRLDKFDTSSGIESLRHAASHHVPYAVVLYERFLGRPFASHRDAVSEEIGDVMESAIERQLHTAQITFRKTARAERVPGYEQAPDFFVPTEAAPAVLIEAKITGDDGTARDKVARVLRLASMRDDRVRQGLPGFELVACIDGRGFGTRRQDMRDLLRATRGKVFALTSLDQLVAHTELRRFASGP